MDKDHWLQLLEDHRPNSANADDYPELTVKSAGLLVSQLVHLQQSVGGQTLSTRDVSEFHSDGEEALLDLLERYGSDKGKRHHYHRVYSYILQCLGREAPIRTLEIGLGTNNPSLVSTMGTGGKPGASLRAFRDFLPNAQVHGADVDRDIVFSEARIQTGFVDQLQPETFNDLPFDLGSGFDLIIDDGLHVIGSNLNTLLFALEHVRPNGWIVIEDIRPEKIPFWGVIDQLLSAAGRWDTAMVQCRKSCLYVVNRRGEPPI